VCNALVPGSAIEPLPCTAQIINNLRHLGYAASCAMTSMGKVTETLHPGRGLGSPQAAAVCGAYNAISSTLFNWPGE